MENQVFRQAQEKNLQTQNTFQFREDIVKQRARRKKQKSIIPKAIKIIESTERDLAALDIADIKYSLYETILDYQKSE